MCSKIFENVINPFCGTGSLIGIGALKETFFGVGDAGFPWQLTKLEAMAITTNNPAIFFMQGG
jgi:hypothetical protein